MKKITFVICLFALAVTLISFFSNRRVDDGRLHGSISSVPKEPVVDARASSAHVQISNQTQAQLLPDKPMGATKQETGEQTRAMPLSAAELAAVHEARSVEEVIAMDVADGINAEVREKEALLRKRAENLLAGLSPHQAIEFMGLPDTAKKWVVEGDQAKPVDLLSSDEYWHVASGYFGYWPRVGVPFNGKNGQGYHVLYLWFDANGQLASWQWKRPVIDFMGGVGKIALTEQDYWFGIHEKSGPPPVESPPAFSE
jgi:hypothetical protein